MEKFQKWWYKNSSFYLQKGNSIVATDISSQSETFIEKKIKTLQLSNLEFKKCSFTDLRNLKKGKFDCIFSNYGGLNCIDNLDSVFDQFDDLLNPNGYILLVIMPPFYPFEMLTFLKGNKKAFRRLNKNGTIANVENQKIEIDCLTQNIYREAGIEPESGMVAVGLVTMNRVKTSGFPKTVCTVVKQKTKSTCQFSWFCSGCWWCVWKYCNF